MRRTRQIGSLGAAILIAVTGYAGTASAAPAGKAKPVQDITLVGAQTTQELMSAVVNDFNGSALATTANAHATNVFAQPPDPGTTAPSDAKCNGGVPITWIQEANPGTNQRTAPNGATAGRAALAASVSNGDSCVSVARSTSIPSANDPSGTEAYAFAVDNIDWVAQSGGAAPANLTMTQLEQIYSCQVTNWDQVGGANAPIVRYYPLSGSGVATFFAGMLGFDPRTLGGENTCSSVPNEIEQNTGTDITTSPADAIFIYSAGAWIEQANGIDADARNGFTLRSINGKGSPVLGTAAPYTVNTKITTEKNVEPASYQPSSNTAVQGVNNLFNFINTNSVDYKGAAAVVGPKSALCTNGESSNITTYGFNPLTKCKLISAG